MFKSVILGLLLGFGVSGTSYLVAKRFVETGIIADMKNKKTAIYMITKLFVKLFVLFLVRKNIPMLIATAVGLTSTKNILFLKILLKKELRKERGELVKDGK